MDKRSVAQHFSHAAASYDAAAHLQRTVADHLLSLSKQQAPATPDTIVDLGTGTGYCLPYLQNLFQPQCLYALDLSATMLACAQPRCPQASLVQADLEYPPFRANSLDLAVSNLAVQWLDAPQPFIDQITNALKPGGILALSTLGPQTLYELKHAWAEVDAGKHVNNFHPATDWLDAIWQSDLTLAIWRQTRIQIAYQAPIQLLHELKALGANHVDRTVAAKHSHLRQMLKQYDAFRRSDGRYPATWDIFYIIARKQ